MTDLDVTGILSVEGSSTGATDMFVESFTVLGPTAVQGPLSTTEGMTTQGDLVAQSNFECANGLYVGGTLTCVGPARIIGELATEGLDFNKYAKKATTGASSTPWLVNLPIFDRINIETGANAGVGAGTLAFDETNDSDIFTLTSEGVTIDTQGFYSVNASVSVLSSAGNTIYFNTKTDRSGAFMGQSAECLPNELATISIHYRDSLFPGSKLAPYLAASTAETGVTVYNYSMEVRRISKGRY